MSSPMVSICSITYNHAPFIRQCLDGFLMQQCNFPIEIIINDDCSTDGTTEIIREYAEKYPDKIFPIFHEENQYSKGVRGMFQKFVFPKARGKYIAMCEGDDYWTDPLKLQKQVDFLESHPDYSMCCHRSKLLYDGLPHVGRSWYEHIDNCELDIACIMRPPAIPTASIMLRTYVARKAPIHKDFIAGDIIIHATALTYGRVYGLSGEMAIYRRHSDGWSFTTGVHKDIEILSIPHYLAMMECFPRKITKEIKRRVAYKCYDWLLQCRSGHKILSLKFLPKALFYCNVDLLRIAIVHLHDKLVRIVKKT